jgi:hypothetical protein
MVAPMSLERTRLMTAGLAPRRRVTAGGVDARGPNAPFEVSGDARDDRSFIVKVHSFTM